MAVLGVRLSFYNPNDFGQGFRVYRKEGESFDENSLPTVLDEFGPQSKGMVQYIDETAEPEVEYWYMVSIFYGTHEVFVHAAVKGVAYAGPLAIGEFYQGGLYAANIHLDHNYGLDEGTYAIIVATEDAGNPSLKWKTTNSTTANTIDDIDGWANTLAMIDAGIEAHPAAEHCVNWRGGGHDDWYLGAQEEWTEINKNRSFNNLWSELALPTSGRCWSSTQSSSSARFMDARTGSWYDFNKTNEYAVRPIRRIKLAV